MAIVRGRPPPRDPDIKETIAELEEKLERLRVLFEQYFLGIEKRPPLDRRNEVQKMIRRLQSRRISKTALRFHFQALVGRFNIYDSYWTRIMRRIEEGTYERDVFKAKLRASTPGVPATAAPPPPNNVLPEERMREIYERFVEARRQCGESVEGITFNQIRATLLREAPRIAEKSGASSVDFQVVIRGGRAVLKAVPNRESQ